MKSKFEIKVKTLMLEQGFNLSMLAEDIGYNSGHNLGTAIKNNKISDSNLVLMAKALKTDVGELFKLKVL